MTEAVQIIVACVGAVGVALACLRTGPRVAAMHRRWLKQHTAGRVSQWFARLRHREDDTPTDSWGFPAPPPEGR